MTNRRVSSRSRSLSRPSARHATRGTASSSSWQGGAPIEKAKLQYALARARERSHSPIKGKGKCKDKGKGKGQPKGQRKGWHMNAFKKDTGFKKVNFELVDWILDIDIFKYSLWLVPLAVGQMTNPVYAHKPAQGVPHKQILRDLSHSPDCDGIMAIGPLEIGTLGTKELICANVRLSTGEEGWINVAMRDLSDLPLQSRQWTIYLKVCAVDRATPIMNGASPSTDDNGARVHSETISWSSLDHYQEYLRLKLKEDEVEHAGDEEGGSTLDSECSTDSQGYRIEDFLPEEPEYTQFMKRREAKKKIRSKKTEEEGDGGNR